MSTQPAKPTPDTWWNKLVISLEFADLTDPTTCERLDSAAAKANNQGIHLAASWQYGRALPMLTAALEVWTKLGQFSGAVNVRNVRGTIYRRIGDYDATQADHREAMLLARENDLPAGESAARTGLALVSAATGDLAQAERLAQEALQQSQAVEDEAGVANAQHALGLIYEAGKEWQLAQEAYDAAWSRWDAVRAPAEQIEAVAGVMRTLLARGYMMDATSYGDQVLRHVAEHGPARLTDPLLLYWTLYRVMHTVRDEENAFEVLRAANMLMLRQMDGLTTEQREQFRAEVPLHRDIADTWMAVLTAQAEARDSQASDADPGTDG